MNTAIKLPSSHTDSISGSFLIAGRLELTFGQQLNNTVVSYSIYGDINKPVIAILGGISADQFVADTNVEGIFVQGWWDKLVGYGKAVDLNRYCVLSFSYVDGQTSDKRVDRANAPSGDLKLSTFDQANILKLLLKELKIEQLHAIIGSSYGGMVGLAFAQSHPQKLNQLVAICCTEKSSAKNTAYRALQRKIIKFSLKNNDIDTGLEIARSIAMLGYRGSDEIEQRFENHICPESKTIRFPVTSYLKNHGEKFARRFNAIRFVNLSLSVDLHHVNPKKITVPCFCVGIKGDHIAPSEKVKSLANRIGQQATFASIESKCGHDGFLTEHEQLIPIIKKVLEN